MKGGKICILKDVKGWGLQLIVIGARLFLTEDSLVGALIDPPPQGCQPEACLCSSLDRASLQANLDLVIFFPCCVLLQGLLTYSGFSV